MDATLPNSLRVLKRISKRTIRLLSKLAPRLLQRQDRHPIHHLPPELLSRVFEMCMVRFYPQQILFLWSYDKFVNFGQPMSSRTLTQGLKSDLFRARQLSQVCQLWRAVAISTPSLWMDVDLERPMWGIAVLHRSGTLPLYLSMGGFEHGSPREQLYCFISADAQMSARVVSIKYRTQHLAFISLDLIHETFANVQHLTLSHINPGPMTTFTDLTRLTLHALYGHIALHCPSDLIGILQRNPRLEKVSLSGVYFANNFLPDSGVELHHIQSFNFRYAGLMEVILPFICIVRPAWTSAACGKIRHWHHFELRDGIISLSVKCSVHPSINVEVAMASSNLTGAVLRSLVNCTLVDLTDVSSLKIRSSDWDVSIASHGFWRCLLERLPALERVEFWYPPRHSDIDSFLLAVLSEPVATDSGPTFISLKVVEIWLDTDDPNVHTLHRDVSSSVVTHLQIYQRLCGKRLEQLMIYPRLPYHKKELSELVDNYRC